MAFKMKGFGGFRKKNPESALKSRESTPIYDPVENLITNEVSPSSITDHDEWKNLQNKYPDDESWKYTDQEWQELVYPSEQVMDDDDFTQADLALTNHMLDANDSFVEKGGWIKDRRPEEEKTAVSMKDVVVKPKKSKEYGTSVKDIPESASYKQRMDYKKWKKELNNLGFKGAYIDNSWQEYLKQKELGIVEATPIEGIKPSISDEIQVDMPDVEVSRTPSGPGTIEGVTVGPDLVNKKEEQKEEETGDLSKMAFGSTERIEEYKKRGWAMDHTTQPEKMNKIRFATTGSDRKQRPVDNKKDLTRKAREKVDKKKKVEPLFAGVDVSNLGAKTKERLDNLRDKLIGNQA